MEPISQTQDVKIKMENPYDKPAAGAGLVLVPSENLTCPDCGQTFRLRRFLLTHKFKCTKKPKPPRKNSKRRKYQLKNKRKSKYPTNLNNNNPNATKQTIKPRKYYQCDQSPCTRIYAFKQGLDRHKIIFHKIGQEAQPAQCTLCHVICSNQVTLTAHMRKMHKLKNSSLECPHCKVKCLEAYWLNRHLRINKLQLNPLICQHCNQKFSYKCAYKKHSFRCDQIPFQIRCPQCPRTFQTQPKLNSHHYYAHSTDPNPPCPHCHKQYSNISATKSHIAKVHGPKKPKSFTCEYCNLLFRTAANLRSHHQFSLGYTKDVTRLDCKQCGHESLFKCQAKQHIREQTCPNCQLHFTCAQLFEDHVGNGGCERDDGKWEYINCEGQEWGYPCAKCMKVYPTFPSWRVHSYMHDDMASGKEFACTFEGCGKSFKARVNLRNHTKNYHRDIIFTCEDCGRQMKHRGNFLKHRKHGVCMVPRKGRTPSKNLNVTFPCPHCGHSFNKYNNLQRHLAIMLPKVQGKLPKCDGCKKTFEAKCLLNAHLEIEQCPMLKPKYSRRKFPKLKDIIPKKIVEKKISAPKPKPKSQELQDASTLSCIHCQQKFTREVSLQRHLDLNRGGRSAGQLICSDCKRIFEFKCEKAHHICGTEEEKESEQEEVTVLTTITTDTDSEMSMSLPLPIVTPNLEVEPSKSTTIPNPDKDPDIPTGTGCDSGGPFWCWACNVSFNRKSPFFQHIRNVHNEEPE